MYKSRDLRLIRTSDMYPYYSGGLGASRSVFHDACRVHCLGRENIASEPGPPQNIDHYFIDSGRGS